MAAPETRRVTADAVRSRGGDATGALNLVDAGDIARLANDALANQPVDIVVNDAAAFVNRGWEDATPDDWLEPGAINVAAEVRARPLCPVNQADMCWRADQSWAHRPTSPCLGLHRSSWCGKRHVASPSQVCTVFTSTAAGIDADRAGIARVNAIFGTPQGRRERARRSATVPAATETGSYLNDCSEPESGIEPLNCALREGSLSSQTVPNGR